MQVTETKIRSIAKSLSWRFVAVLNGFVIAIFFLGSIKQSLYMSLCANFSGLILYYFYERIWNRISWQREIK